MVPQCRSAPLWCPSSPCFGRARVHRAGACKLRKWRSFGAHMIPLQRIHTLFTAILVFGTACVAEDEDDPAQSSTTASSGATTSGSGVGTTTTTSGNGGSSSSSTSSTGGSSGGVESCVDLCSLAPVDVATHYCVSEFVTAQGYCGFRTTSRGRGAVTPSTLPTDTGPSTRTAPAKGAVVSTTAGWSEMDTGRLT